MKCMLAMLAAAAVAAASAQSLNTKSNTTELMCGPEQSTSGYIPVRPDDDVNYFYWLFESRSSPSDDPLVLWMTGGPGCSSELAVFFENGPCTVNSDGTTLSVNEYAWNTKANMLYIDQPAGVGFSTGTNAGWAHNEAQVSADMYTFLQGFFKAFPQYTGREFFIVGESYGGHFAPATAHAVYEGNAALKQGDVFINLQGLAVGNGLVDPSSQYAQYAPYAYNYTKSVLGTPVISESAYNSMMAALPLCLELINECQSNTGDCSFAQEYCNSAEMGAYENTGLNVYDFKKPCDPEPLCYNFSPITNFLNLQSTQKAMGVASQGVSWTTCNYEVNAGFSSDWMKDFQIDIPVLLANNTRVLIYSGDLDFICNWLGGQAWTKAMKWPGQAEFNAAPMTAWTANGEHAGDSRTYNDFTFLRVFNAGHMVPHDQPAVALAMLEQFLAGQKFP